VQNSKAFIRLIFVTAVIADSAVGLSPSRQQAPIANNKVMVKTSQALSVLAQAKSAALRIKNAFQRGLVLDEIGAAEAKSGELDAAIETANRAYPHMMAALMAIGKELGNSNDLSKAKYLASKLKGGEASTVFDFMAQRQAEEGRIGEALKTTEHIQAPEVRNDALDWIALQQAKRGDYSGARKTSALARTAYPAGPLTLDDNEIEAMIVADQLSRGDTQEARKTIAAMKSPETRFFIMTSGAEELFRLGDKVSASEWLEDALQQLPAGPDNDFSRYITIPTQVKVGKKDAAMKAAGALPSDLRAKGYMAIAVVCAETKDIGCVDGALARMQSLANPRSKDDGLSDFVVKMNILNITAAFIDHGHFEAASRLLAMVDRDLDDISSKMGIQPEVQLQRAVMMAQQGAFKSARALALKMRPNSVSEIERGTALRTIAVLDTKKNGIASSKPWALALADSEDRAYALLGIAQSLLEMDDIKLPYSAIQIH
jgi:hypothetical protein